MDFQTMSKQRKFVLIAAAVGIVGTFLPWWRISIFGYTSSTNGFHGWGILSFFCFVAAGVIAYMDDQTKNLDKTKWTITLIAGAISTLIMAWFIIDATSSPLSSFMGFGAYIAALGAIGVLLSAFLFRSPGDNIKGGFDSLKKDISNRMGNNSPTNTGNTNTNPPV